jgi:hypothetical protein
MAITTAVCTSYKQEVLQGLHNFNVGGNVFRPLSTLQRRRLARRRPSIRRPTRSRRPSGFPAGGLVLTNISPVVVGTVASPTSSMRSGLRRRSPLTGL